MVGPAAWLLWAVVHIFFLIGFRNRLIVMLRWAWTYFVFARGARLIIGEAPLELREPARSAFAPGREEPEAAMPGRTRAR
jgi:NADH dehydrogenase